VCLRENYQVPVIRRHCVLGEKVVASWERRMVHSILTMELEEETGGGSEWWWCWLPSGESFLVFTTFSKW
jgi:hypothetical protein